jgi:hypothetical protein
MLSGYAGAACHNAENADRQSLYQAIANANGHPEWTTQIKSTFTDPLGE